MCSAIILIGPLCAGKSTVGQLLAGRLCLPQLSVDALPREYFTTLGLDPEQVEMLTDRKQWLAAYNYLQTFGVKVIERVLEEHRREVIDFGAPYSTYSDNLLFEGVKKALAPCRNVVLLLPSPDLDRSTMIVKQRMAERSGHTELRRMLAGLHAETGVDYEELYVKHPSNFQLAQIVVYTEGQSPEQTRDEIIGRLNL